MQNLIAFLLPAIIDLINRKIIDTDLRFWISVLVCVLVGTLMDYLVGGFSTIEIWAEQVLIIFGIAQLSYGAIYKNSGLQKMLRN